MQKDYYDILGITQNASKEDIKQAYHILAHQFHPDKNQGKEKRFKEINEAYRILSNDKNKAQYDLNYKPRQESNKQKENEDNKNKTSSQNSNKPINNDSTNFSINKSQLFWVLISIGLLIEIISSFSSGGVSFPRLLGQLLGGLVISKIIAHIFSVIKKENDKEQQKVNWAIAFLIISIITLVVTLSRNSNSTPDIQQNQNNLYSDNSSVNDINSFVPTQNTNTNVPKYISQSPSSYTLEQFKNDCTNLPNTSYKEGVATTATIDKSSLVSTSESTAIYGTYSNTHGYGGISVRIWEGRLTLPTTQESIYYDGTDHGGGVEFCPIGSSSGIYFNKIWKPLKEGDYTVGIYSYSNIYTDGGYQGNTTPILLATDFLKVVPK